METAISPVKVPDSGRAQHLHVVTGACSRQGVRRDTNEDCQYVSPNLDLFIVADGMGGHGSGEVASKFAVDVLSQELAKIGIDANDEDVTFHIHAALDRAHCLIVDSSHSDLGGSRPGTTVVFGLLVNHRLYISGVGDSRAFQIRGASIERLTIDDTWPDTLFHLGQISADEARHHHMRNKLLVALGLEDFDSGREEIRAVDVFDGDRYLLASDGLTDVVDEDNLLEIIRENDDPQVAAEQLMKQAIKNKAGDDVTCVLFYIESDTNRVPPTSLWQRIRAVFQSK